MDELEISGIRYISSRRAAKEHKYHPDYIGQLIRAGKVPGLKVGRAWYVDATALTEYFNGEVFSVSSSEEKTPIPIAVPQIEELIPEPPPVIVEEEVLSPVVELKEKVIEPVEKEEPTIVHIRKFVDEIPQEREIQSTGGLKYVADNGPLFPLVERRYTHTISPAVSPTLSHIERNSYPEIRQKNHRFPFLALTFLGTIAFLISAILSTGSTLTLSAGSGAAVAIISFDTTYVASLIKTVK